MTRDARSHCPGVRQGKSGEEAGALVLRARPSPPKPYPANPKAVTRPAG